MTDLLLLSIVIALGFLVAVAFYEGLSTRDVLVGRLRRLANRLSPSPWVAAVTYVITVLVLIPALVLVWSVVLYVALFFIGSVDIVENDLLITVAVIGATRILAYANARGAHELAKAIPLALAFALLTGGDLHLIDKLERLNTATAPASSDDWFVFLVSLEVVLRVMTDVTHKALGHQRQRLGLGEEVGFWQTLWATVRRRPAGA